MYGHPLLQSPSPPLANGQRRTTTTPSPPLHINLTSNTSTTNKQVNSSSTSPSMWRAFGGTTTPPTTHAALEASLLGPFLLSSPSTTSTTPTTTVTGVKSPIKSTNVQSDTAYPLSSTIYPTTTSLSSTAASIAASLTGPATSTVKTNKGASPTNASTTLAISTCITTNTSPTTAPSTSKQVPAPVVNKPLAYSAIAAKLASNPASASSSSSSSPVISALPPPIQPSSTVLSDEQFPSLGATMMPPIKPVSKGNSPLIKPTTPSISSTHSSPNVGPVESNSHTPATTSSTSASPSIRPRQIPLHLFQATPTDCMPDLFLPTAAIKSTAPPVIPEAPTTVDDDFESAKLFDPRIHMYDHFTMKSPTATASPVKHVFIPATSAAIPIPQRRPSPNVIPSPIHFPSSPCLDGTSGLASGSGGGGGGGERGKLSASPSFDFSDVIRAETMSKSTSFSHSNSIGSMSTQQHHLHSCMDDDDWQVDDSMMHSYSSLAVTPASYSANQHSFDSTDCSDDLRASTTAKAQSSMIKMMESYHKQHSHGSISASHLFTSGVTVGGVDSPIDELEAEMDEEFVVVQQ